MLNEMADSMKLRITSYFNELIDRVNSRLDSLKIREDSNVCSLNEKRDQFIDEIKKIESFNLQHYESINVEKLENEANERVISEIIFKRFGFIFNHDEYDSSHLNSVNIGSLVIIDEYLSPEELVCFKKLHELNNKIEPIESFDIFFEFNSKVALF
jgi:hypothetical protein